MKWLLTFSLIFFAERCILAQDTLTNHSTARLVQDLDSTRSHSKRDTLGTRQKKKKLLLIPGINLFLLTAQGSSIDINPYVAVKLNNRWTLGVGWNQRINFHRTYYGGPQTSRLFGPRFIFQYQLKYGFSFRLLPECMDVRLPQNVVSQGHSRDNWVWSAFVGIRKDIRVNNHLLGYVELLYNFASTSSQNLYGDPVNFRIGMEWNKRSTK